MSDIKLYNYYRSSTSYRARAALYYKNINFEYIPVHLLNDGGEHKKQQYREINPMSGVPTLTHNGKSISQTMAIFEYLEDTFPTPALFPKDFYLKAKVRQICENISCELHPLSNLRVMQYLEKKHSYTSDEKQKWIQHWNLVGLEATEKALVSTAGEFSVGDQISAADFFITTHLYSARRFEVDLSAFKNILKVEQKCLGFEFFKKAHPHVQIDTLEELRSKT
jgi:maleylacetoacetate isomerase